MKSRHTITAENIKTETYNQLAIWFNELKSDIAFDRNLIAIADNDDKEAIARKYLAANKAKRALILAELESRK